LADIGFKKIEKMATGQSGQVELSLEIIKDIEIKLPDIKTQKRIIKEIEIIEDEINTLQTENEQLQIKKTDVLKKYL
jgi:restriction endonuclease S subunit